MIVSDGILVSRVLGSDGRVRKQFTAFGAMLVSGLVGAAAFLGTVYLVVAFGKF